MGSLPFVLAFATATIAAAPAAADDGLHLLWSAPEVIAPMPVELAVARTRSGRLVEVGDVVIEASAGEVRLLPREPGRLLATAVFYPPRMTDVDTLEVTLIARAGDDKVRRAFHLDSHLPGRVEVEVSTDRLVKGADARAAVTVRALDASGAPIASRRPRLVVNVGSVGELERADVPGEWTATYHPSRARYPEVAVFAALLPWPHEQSPALAFGHAVLPLAAAIDLPGEVRPRVRVAVEIAGETFGPVLSCREGGFEVPVVVPPGHGVGRGISVDRFGNRRETEIDLRLPPTNRITGAVHPGRLVAEEGSRARIVILAVDPHGAPSHELTPEAAAVHGTVSELVDRGDGVFVGWYEPPLGVEEAGVTDVVTAGIPGDARSQARLEVKLLSGPPARIEHSIEPAVVAAPSDSPASLELRVVDALGSPVPDAILKADAGRGVIGGGGEGTPAYWRVDGGELRLEYDSPLDARGWEDQVRVSAGLAASDRPVTLLLDESTGELAVVDSTSRPVPGVPVEIDGEVRTSRESGRLGEPPAGAGVVEAILPGMEAPARLWLATGSAGEQAGFPARSLRVDSLLSIPLMEPVPVEVEAELAPADAGRLRLVWRIIGGEGDREVSVRHGGLELLRGPRREGELLVEVEPGAPLMVVDVATGVSAVVLAPREPLSP